MAEAGAIMTRVCKVKSISFNVDIAYSDASKGTYKGVELVYEQEFNGKKEIKEKKFVQKSLDHAANAELKSGLTSLKNGDTFTGTFKKNDRGFWDMVSVVKGGQVVNHPTNTGGSAPAQRSAPVRKDATSEDNKSGLSDYELGITCGMALNNAVAILGEGAKLDQVEKLGYEFVQMAIRFKENVRAGVFSPDQVKMDAKPQAKQPEAQPEPAGPEVGDGDFDSDIPF